jgi:branched-chain amino acid transport system permease protein
MDYLADIGVTILIYIILGVSLNLLLGYAGEVSLAHAVFFGIGGYAAGLLTLPVAEGATAAAARGVTSGLGWPQLPAIVAATVVAFVFAFAISLPAVLRVSGEYLILLTLAFQIVVNQLMSSLTELTGGPYGLTPIPPITLFGSAIVEPPRFFLLLLVITLLVILICWGLVESPFGRRLRGIREDEIVVRALGKATALPTVTVFGIAAAIAGMAGALGAFYFQFIAPSNYNLNLSIFVVSVVVLGGVANLTGTVLAAIVLGSITPILREVIGDEAVAWQAVIYGLALVIVMRYRPQGLLPEGAGLSRLFQRRTNSRPDARRKATVSSDARTRPGDGSGTHQPPPVAARVGQRLPNAKPNGAADGDPVVVEVQGLVKRFGGITAVDGADFVLREGNITALLGGNGAGKTTIFNLITGLITPDAGRVRLRGRDITGHTPQRVARMGMARSFQDTRVFHRMTVLDNVAIAVPHQPGEQPLNLLVRPLHTRRAERRTREKAVECLSFVGLDHRKDELVANLSFGEQKLVAIARLLATDSEVLLLDEPTSGVDPGAVENVIDLVLGLRGLGRTVCVVEHSVHFVERLADHAFFMDHGKVIASGTLQELTQQERLVEIYFGT